VGFGWGDILWGLQQLELVSWLSSQTASVAIAEWASGPEGSGCPKDRLP
jgi:hypothetical protein